VGNYAETINSDHGFIYNSGAYTSLDVPGRLSVWSINDSGQIIGTSENRGFIYSGDAYTILDPPGSTGSGAPLGINQSGEVVGSYIVSGVPAPPCCSSALAGFLYSNGAYTTLDVPGSSETYDASGINDSGQIIGYFAIGFANYGYLYSNGVYTILDVPGPSAVPMAINDSGQIVGFYIGEPIYPVPEPSTWAMMLIGFAGLGYAGYRRQKKLVGAASA
jgi:PEP-CTERM motif